MSYLNRGLDHELFSEKEPIFDRAHYLGLILLWLMACALALLGLGDLPLRDFDEGTVARVAFELSQQRGIDFLFPTLWDSPYLNKPPGIHWLIAFAINISSFGSTQVSRLPTEAVIRIVPALLSTLIVPVGGLIQGYLRPYDRLSSFATSAILLTLLPIVRHGRLAMLDGTQLSAIGILWLLLLSLDRTPMDRWKAFGAGLSVSVMLMLKAPLLLPAGLAALVPMLWGGGFRYFGRIPVSVSFGLGLLPGLSWHLWHALHRGIGALWLWSGDGAARVLFDAGEGSDLGWRVPVIEIIEGGWPWLFLWPFAILWAWKQRDSKWAQWSLGSQIVLAIAVLPLKTQLPWYGHPLWLPFALSCAVPLSWLIRRDNPWRPPAFRLLKMMPLILILLGCFLCLFGLLGATYWTLSFRQYSAIAISVGVGWSCGGWLLGSAAYLKRMSGAIIITFGSLIGLSFLMASPLWLWELNESWPVEPVVELTSRVNEGEVFMEGNDERPSLNWYARRRIRVLKDFDGVEWILTRDPERVVEIATAQVHECLPVEKEGKWTLLSCSPTEL